MRDTKHHRTPAEPEADGASESSAARPPSQPRSRLNAKVAIGVAIIVSLVGLYWVLSETGMLSVFSSRQVLREWIEQLGLWGPLAIIGLMIAAIVMTPIPSGPLAMVAGAAYGPLWGTVYVVLGAQIGAILAFWIARVLGYEAIRRWERMRPLLDRLGKSESQTWLMAVVFASRLVPFLSFDGVSYAAGLTPLAFWRFALATVVGVIPVAFLLAYFGERLWTRESDWVLILGGLAGAITLLPIGLKLLWSRYQKLKGP